MNNVIALPIDSRQISLREAYRQAIGEAINATERSGYVDQECSRVMFGFLNSAVIAFRVIGDESMADIFERYSINLNANWQSFDTLLRQLFELLSE